MSADKDKRTHVVSCISCAYMMLWDEHVHLRGTVACPDCGKDNFAGPGVFVEDYQGTPIQEALRRRREVLTNPNVAPIGWLSKGYKFVDGEWRAP